MRDSRGSAALELVLIAPALLVVFTMVVLMGRVTQARSDVDMAARDAARAASMARGPEQAAIAGMAAGRESLAASGSCATPEVEVDISGFGPGGKVTVKTGCQVEIEALVGLWVPGRATLRSTFTEPVDLYRGTQP